MDDRTTEPAVVTTTTRACGGVTAHNVRYVLLFSTVTLVILFAGLWLYYFS